MKYCVLFALIATVAYCLPADLYKLEWENFKVKYNKIYISGDEETHRFSIFSENLDKIYEHNKKFDNGESTYTMAVTNFTDLTHEEFIEFLKEEGGIRSTQVFDASNTYEQEWQNFKQTYHKTYSTKEEEEYRFLIFSNTLDEVREHNKLFEEGLSTYKVGINKFADLTTEERLQYMMTLVSSPDDVQKEFEDFKQKYQKSYSSKEEEEYRFKIFSNTLEEVNKHNELFEKGLSTFKMGINKFADLTAEERHKYMMTMVASQGDDRKEWEDFKQKFHKSYLTEDEEQYRFQIFSKSLTEVRKHNELFDQGLSTYKMGINQFSDLTDEERRELNKTKVLPNNFGQEWENFKQKFHKSYPTEKEEQYRYAIFSKTLEEVNKHNELYEKGLSTYKMGINKFSDLTAEERRKYMMTMVLVENEDQKEWEDFKVTYHKSYATKEEEEYRFQIFSKTLAEVRANNELYKKGQSTYVMGINKFADLTAEERRKITMVPTSFMAILPKDVYEKEWENFKNTYQKLYDSKDEESMRYKIFCNNLDKITLHNKLYDMGLSTSKMGINKFADYTTEEFNKMMGYKPHH